jgi:DNA-directed RNA polymerase subunit RPC12/RpoP
MDYRPKTPKDNHKNILVILLPVFLLLAFCVIAFLALRPTGPTWFFIIPSICLATGAIIVIGLTKWQIDTFGYECPSCQRHFEIGLGTALSTPHIWDKKLLRCPSCGKRVWAREVVKIK